MTNLFCFGRCPPFPVVLGADFKNNQKVKQLNNFIWTNRKQVKFCFYLPIGQNRIVQLFSCLIVFFNPLPVHFKSETPTTPTVL